MSRLPSVETQLRTVKAELREARIDVSRLRVACAAITERAIKAEKEASEWKERFDVLLRKEHKP